MTAYGRSLFLFRRDLRLPDNTALAHAQASSREVVAAFIFDPRQCEPHPYFSANAKQFLCRSLDELGGEIAAHGGALQRFYGMAEDVIDELLGLEKFDALFINKDYTPFSRRRDAAIKKLCHKRGVHFEECDDVLLSPPGTVMKKAGGPYTVFTPFRRQASSLGVALPRPQPPSNLSLSPLRSSFLLRSGQVEVPNNPRLALAGGRREGLDLLGQLKRRSDYERERDIPSLDATSHLSAHLKFGTVSVREAYHAVARVLGGDHELITQLYWRDFFTHIAYYFPHVFGGCFYDEYDGIPWENDEGRLTAWCEGRTGVPIVDAGMRQLNATGYMHNRVRMVAASFLVKDLHIDWRRGERYFATRLIDYDPAVNNGNWQWAASTGCDHQPYFRVFNPWLQQAKFDPRGRYIRAWVPELRDKSDRQIHAPADPKIHLVAAEWSREAFREASRRAKTH